MPERMVALQSRSSSSGMSSIAPPSKPQSSAKADPLAASSALQIPCLNHPIVNAALHSCAPPMELRIVDKGRPHNKQFECSRSQVAMHRIHEQVDDTSIHQVMRFTISRFRIYCGAARFSRFRPKFPNFQTEQMDRPGGLPSPSRQPPAHTVLRSSRQAATASLCNVRLLGTHCILQAAGGVETTLLRSRLGNLTPLS